MRACRASAAGMQVGGCQFALGLMGCKCVVAAARGGLEGAALPPLLHCEQGICAFSAAVTLLNRVAIHSWVLRHCVQWAAGAARQNLEELARWAPETRWLQGPCRLLRQAVLHKCAMWLSIAWAMACLAAGGDASSSMFAASFVAALRARHSLPSLSNWSTSKLPIFRAGAHCALFGGLLWPGWQLRCGCRTYEVGRCHCYMAGAGAAEKQGAACCTRHARATPHGCAPG